MGVTHIMGAIDPYIPMIEITIWSPDVAFNKKTPLTLKQIPSS